MKSRFAARGFVALILLVLVAFPNGASAQSRDQVRETAPDLFDSNQRQAVREYANEVDEEYGYRKRVDAEAAKWAQELMFMYKVSAKYPADKMGRRARPTNEDHSLQLQSEFAWITIAGHGLIATFDFSHAEQTLLGSTSRLVGALTRSSNFWIEVRNQCLEIQELKKSKGISTEADSIRSCADRIKRDLSISQMVGSNVSLFIGGGLVIGLGKRLFQRYASKWVAARVLPLLPAFARTKWAAIGAMTAIVVLPTSLVVASLSNEYETNKIFLENIETSLKDSKDSIDQESIMRRAALVTEREVLELALWISQKLPKELGSTERVRFDDVLARDFVLAMRISAPHYSKLLTKFEELKANRERLESDLGRIPGISAKLLALAHQRKVAPLEGDDARLMRQAQYLAALRLVVNALQAGSFGQ